jgi:hypothetical protein
MDQRGINGVNPPYLDRNSYQLMLNNSLTRRPCSISRQLCHLVSFASHFHSIIFQQRPPQISSVQLAHWISAKVILTL